MELNLKLGKKGGGKPQKLNKKNAPQKRSINLAEIGVKKTNYPVAIAALVLILVGAACLAKFGVIDRLITVDQARREVAALQTQVEEGYAAIEAVGDLADKYAHYTYSGMTDAELSRADRVEVLDLIDRMLLNRDNISVASWTLHDNLLTLQLTGDTLQELNLACQQLEQDALVDYCTVTTASTNELLDYQVAENVNAVMEIHLAPSEEVYW